jgi:membrane protein DedA with SNARE-associated domain
MDALIQQYGYLGLLLGAFMDSPTVLVVGGFAASRGYLGPEGALAAAFLGAYLSGWSKFLLGRRYGTALLARHPAWRPRAERVDAVLARHRLGLILTFRFLYGLRAATPLALGAGRTGRGAFLAFNAAGAALWAGAFGLAGYFFGSAAGRWVARLKEYDLKVMAGIVVVGVALRLLYLAVQARRAPA